MATKNTTRRSLRRGLKRGFKLRLRARMLLAFLSLAMIIVFAGGFGTLQIRGLHRAAAQVTDEAVPYLSGILEARLAVARAQLLMENIATGFELIERVGEVDERFDHADMYLDAILDGGTIGDITFPPARIRGVRLAVDRMRSQMIAMRGVAERRMTHVVNSGMDDQTLRFGFNRSYTQYEVAADDAQEVLRAQALEMSDQMNQTAFQGMILLLVATGIGLILALVLALSIASNVTNRVLRSMTMARKLADGNLTGSVEISGADEIGDLGRNIAHAMDSLRAIIQTVIERIDVLNSTGDTLAENTTQTATAIEEINKRVEETSAQNEDLVANVTETSAIIEQMARNIESLDGHVQQQSAVVEQSSASIEEMISSIESISTISTRAQEQVQRLTDAADEGRRSLDQQEQTVGSMSTSSESLQEANDLISGVAEQTNLLAMNAAIEAAHAGEAGKGFSVVSDEIRKLAEMTSDQSRQVTRDIAAIRTLISDLVTGSRTSSDAFESIQAVLGDVRSVFQEIYSAMEEQRSGGSEILEALSQMREMTTSVQGGSGEMRSGNDQMLTAIRNVNEITHRSKEAMETISTGVAQISRAIADISSVSDINRTQIEEISEATTRLTVVTD